MRKRKNQGRRKLEVISAFRSFCVLLVAFLYQFHKVYEGGCGKSTVIGLIQRFYDVEMGSVKVDGINIRELDVQWYGQLSTKSQCYIQAASETTFCLENLMQQRMKLWKQLDLQILVNLSRETLLLSNHCINGIATLKCAKEATSTLDMQSEQVVQEALDRIMVGRTTIVIAHRLNAIKKVDSIAFVADGKVMDRGTYAQLKNQQGAFSKLASLQT
ncbi:hypothetical protein REPUB_Repub13aG0041200 [Reevesia pubescens]